MKTLRLILGDQLNIKHSWFKTTHDNVVYCMFEMKQETDYVKHHIQKVIGFFAAMRSFIKTLDSQGHKTIYFNINNKNNKHSLTENLTFLFQELNIEKFEYLEPDEFRLDHQLQEFCTAQDIETEMFSSEHFYTKRQDLKTFFKDKKQYLMEHFYRAMRKRFNILMVGNQPMGGEWNYDKSNRKTFKEEYDIPNYKGFKNDVSQIHNDIKEAHIKTIGVFNSKTFDYPINRLQSLEQLKYFCENLLVHFGDYQDAMLSNEDYLFHSRLSFALNLKLISPSDVIKTVLNYYEKHRDEIDISQVEGFIRQIIGWREYMRGMYWSFMPNYKFENQLNNTNSLASFFWNANTKMNCLKQAITNSLENSYAHHIQRLMITGNYALLTQTNPDEVDKWYLGIYADAVEWVQLTNTRGMSQYADGGKIATKPYVSSASYINKMSNYCTSCHYDKNTKTAENSCPFNSLYWNFLDDKRKELGNNFRMGMMYSLLDKIDQSQLQKIKEKAKHIIEHQDEY